MKKPFWPEKNRPLWRRMKVDEIINLLCSKYVTALPGLRDVFVDQRFVEITTVFQGFHGLEALKSNKVSNLMEEMYRTPEQMYVCNYR